MENQKIILNNNKCSPVILHYLETFAPPVDPQAGGFSLVCLGLKLQQSSNKAGPEYMFNVLYLLGILKRYLALALRKTQCVVMCIVLKQMNNSEDFWHYGVCNVVAP